MNNKIKYKTRLILSCFLLCVISLAFFGCNKNLDTSKISKTAVSQSAVQSKEKTQHIKKELDTNLTIDAEVFLPEREAYSTYPMTYQLLTVEELTKSFLEQDSSKKTIKNLQGGSLNLSIKTANGASIIANGSKVLFEADKRSSVINSISQELPKKLFEGPNSLKNLSFMPHKDAIKSGLALLQSLKLSCEPVANPKIMATTGEELNNFQIELLKNPGYREFPKTIVLKDLSKKDDAYYLEFAFQKDGLPIYGTDTEPSISMRNGDMLSPFKMVAIMTITSQGLRYLDMNQALSMNGKGSNPKPIISLEKATECLNKKYSDIILTGLHTVNRVWLEYISVQNSDTEYENAAYTLIPYWCFQMDVVHGNDFMSKSLRWD